MSERLRESVSALMDGETGELELRRLLSDPDQQSVRESWQSYHRLRVSMKAESAEFLHWDISERVSSAIGDDIELHRSGASRPAWLQPLAGFAVAASVAVAVVITASYLNPANSLQDIGQVDTLSRVFPATNGLSVSAGSEQPCVAVRTVPAGLPGDAAQANEEARKRLQQYLLRHTENAAFNNGQGIISFARVANFDVE